MDNLLKVLKGLKVVELRLTLWNRELLYITNN